MVLTCLMVIAPIVDKPAPPCPPPRYPELTSSLKSGQYYTQEVVKEVVQYARERGIRVIPEMDIPYASS